MKKTLIASTLVTLILAPAVNAVEIYHDSKNKVTIGGYMGIRLLTTDGDTEMVNGSSRINFNFSHKLSHGWQANSTFEWGINPFNTSLVFNPDSQFESQSSDLLSSRLAFIGLSHDQYGSISFGRQWSAYYNVVGGTDMAYVWGGETSGAYSLDGSGGVNGTGRADKAIQ